MKRIYIKRPPLKKASRKKKIGLAPGSVVYTGLKSDLELKIDLIQYDANRVEEHSDLRVTDYRSQTKHGKVTWLSINGLNNVDEIEKIGSQFNMNLLDIEDLVNTAQRSAASFNDEYVLVIIKLLSYNENMELKVEHTDLVLFMDSLLMFHESENDFFHTVKDRIRNGKGRIRNRGADYLMFALMDFVVDHYFQVMESLTDKVETLEDRMFLGDTQHAIANDIQLLKKEVLRIRKAVTPLSEITARLSREDGNLLSDQTKVYFKDLHEHISQIVESIEINRDMIWGLMGMHMTLISNKMN